MNYIAYGTRGIEEAKDIRIYAMLPMLREITRTVIQRKCSVESDIQSWQFLRMSITAAFILIRDSIGYIFLICLFVKNDMSIGDFSMYFTAISGIGVWLTKIADSFSNFKEIAGYAEDFYKFMKLPDDETAQKEYRFETPVSFEFLNVHYSYHISNDAGEQVIPAVRGMSFQVKAGEKIALIGTNGAGKSTVIKLLCGMLTPDQGKIFVNGTDISKIPRKSYYSLFSAVFQNSKLLPASIADNITMTPSKAGYRKIRDILQAVGLETKVQSLPAREHTNVVKNITGGVDLSGGQVQKLLLARAVYKNAPVHILDEPTAALDPISEHNIYQKYHELTIGKAAEPSGWTVRLFIEG